MLARMLGMLPCPLPYRARISGRNLCNALTQSFIRRCQMIRKYIVEFGCGGPSKTLARFGAVARLAGSAHRERNMLIRMLHARAGLSASPNIAGTNHLAVQNCTKQPAVCSHSGSVQHCSPGSTAPGDSVKLVRAVRLDRLPEPQLKPPQGRSSSSSSSSAHSMSLYTFSSRSTASWRQSGGRLQSKVGKDHSGAVMSAEVRHAWVN